MIENNKILLGKAEDLPVYLLPQMMNRHGLIAGASGTGKTVTLKVIAEGLSELGVPTFIADIKGDLTGMIVPGDMAGIAGRVESMGLQDFKTCRYPVQFFDVFGEQGHPVRSTCDSMGAQLFSRLLDLTDAQSGILNIIYRVARDMELCMDDLKDLRIMTQYVGDHASDFTIQYGNVSKQSVGAIQRHLLTLEEEGGEIFLGKPELDLYDWFKTEDGRGVMNILECQKLFNKPTLYATFMMWLLTELYDRLPEVGDLDKPKMVFFFDEAHLFFNNAPKALLEKMEQLIKLIRSKGVGVFFITQSPADIPDTVLAQCSNRIQHALRAYTPAEIKTVKMAAQSFRVNPDLDTVETITNMKTGTALVSVLDEEGAPTIVQKTKICPPSSSMEMAPQSEISIEIKSDLIYGKYETEQEAVSAYEKVSEMYLAEEAAKQAEEEAKEQAKLEKEQAKEQARIEKEAERKKKQQQSTLDRIKKKTITKVENEASKLLVKSAKSLITGLFK